jgi:hypothetical protein
MHSMSLIDIDTPLGASYIYINGQIKLEQKSPISSSTIAKTLYYQDVFLNATSPLDFMSTYKEYTSRNITTPLEFEKIVMPYRSNRETLIELDIKIPEFQDIE